MQKERKNSIEREGFREKIGIFMAFQCPDRIDPNTEIIDNSVTNLTIFIDHPLGNPTGP